MNEIVKKKRVSVHTKNRENLNSQTALIDDKSANLIQSKIPRNVNSTLGHLIEKD